MNFRGKKKYILYMYLSKVYFPLVHFDVSLKVLYHTGKIKDLSIIGNNIEMVIALEWL